MEIFCFFIGILFFYTLNYYSLIAVISIFFLTPRPLTIFFFLSGILWAWIHLEFNSPQGMPKSDVIPLATIQGSIASIPIKTPHKTQFIFALEQLNHHPANGLIQLAWYNNAPPLQSGQQWELSVKLKKPKNFHNPGSDNYERALATRHIEWTGYIRNKNNKCLTHHPTKFKWLSFREQLNQQLIRIAPDEQTAGIMEALTLNTTSHITQEQWNRTYEKLIATEGFCSSLIR